MALVQTVNIGGLVPTEHSIVNVTGIDKRPTSGRVSVVEPGPRGVGGSGLEGDSIADLLHHGGSDQAVYAYAREDLDRWELDLGRALTNGAFGENLTTLGADVSGALVGERWRVGPTCLLEVTAPRVPCRTFAGWLEELGWIRRFSDRGAPGAYLRVLVPGTIGTGDEIAVVHRPGHHLTVAEVLRITTDARDEVDAFAAAGEALHAGFRAELERHRHRTRPDGGARKR